MARPPDDESRLDAILSEVREALDEAGIAGEAIRGALLDGVREALGAEPEVSTTGPEMTVVEGGRAPDAPRAAGGAPELTIAEERSQAEPSRTRVVVTRAGDPAPDAKPGRGRIVVQDETQTIFHGAATRAYRLHCERGALRVSLDGQPAESMTTGQSLDVEARLIRVSARGDARGWFARLPGV